MLKRSIFVLVLLSLVLAACGGGGGGQAPAGNADNGKALFAKSAIGKSGAPGCATCHSLEPGKTLVGPSLAGMATDAAGAFKEDEYKGKAKSAQEWLREQIVDPNSETVEGFQPNIMPQNYSKDLAEQEINDLVAYMLTLK